ncbi:MAG TPA: ABC transporter permease [Blastocatellia bacterium]|nr:ABC transporter permease [Blastocatellia bacterium]
MDTLFQDLKYGVRMLVKSPGFTLIAVLALTLGIGASTAIFSVIYAVLLRPLPYQDPDQLVMLWETTPQMDTSVAYPNFIDLRDNQTTLEQFAAFRRDSFNLTGAGEAERLQGRMISHDFFDALRSNMLIGRDFTPEEDRAGGTPVVILNNGFWHRRFGGDQSIIDRPLTLNGKSFTVIGVTPPEFQFGAGADIFVPIGQWSDRFQSRGAHPGIYVLGRMKPGVTVEQARQDLDSIWNVLNERFPDNVANRRTQIESLYDNTVQEVRPALWILFGAVGFVLLIACANVANLLLTRSSVRQKEIAIRAALGASRLRVVRQLLTESVLLSLVGGALGLLLALWGTDALIKAVPDSIPRLQEAGINSWVLGFTFVVAVSTGIIFGLVPALHGSRPDLNETLKESGRGTTGSRHIVRNVLVIVEVALALVVLIGAGLMIRSFIGLQDARLGFDARNLLTLQLSIPRDKADPERVAAFFGEIKQKTEALPGVEAVAYSTGVPFLGAAETSFQIEGRPQAAPGDPPPMTVQYIVSPDYFKAMNIRLKKGRLIDERDRLGSQLVVVIDDTFERLFFADQEALGQHLATGPMKGFEIVGVVEHVKHYGVDGQVPVESQFYLAINQAPKDAMQVIAGRLSMLIRTSSDPASLAEPVRAQVMSTDPDQPVFNVRPMEEVVAASIAGRRFSMLLFAIFAAVALLLAAVGIYGVMSYSVTQRTHEIGIRMALGAKAADILRMVVRQGLLLALIGVGIGLTAAFILTRVMSNLLFGIQAADPATFAGIAAILTLVAAVASYIPARRATKVDPMIALRYE